MQKRGLQFVLLIILTLVLSVSFAYAQDSSSTIDENSPAPELSQTAGITPDNGLYFIETGILEKFRSDISNREKKIAEIKAMIAEGKIDEAKIALERYKDFANALEKEVDPNKQEEAKRSAEAIRATVKDLESQIPEEDKKEFVGDVIDQEKKIETAAEIAGKIKELCETLAKLDPDKYSTTCKTDDDSPDWQKRLDKDLTDEQKKEAKAFIGIMTQCMKDATNCKCEEISVESFAEKCSEVAPLYVQCQQGDEAKCAEADEKSQGIEDVLPDYLQEALADIEDDFDGAQYDNHAPKICQERKVTSRTECMRLVITEGGEEEDGPPPECRQALIDALDKGITSEREFRKICEEVMFKENAPQECIDADIKDNRECGKFMFQQSAPQECIDAGLTGESSRDGRKCQEIMKSFEGDREGPEGQGGGPREGFNFDCRQIQDPDERLKCFDGAVSSYREGPEGQGFNEQEFRDIKEKERQCANSCQEKNAAWDFTGGQCICKEGERRDFIDDRRYEERREFRPPEGFDQNRQMSEEERIRYEEQFRNQPQEQQFQQPLQEQQQQQEQQEQQFQQPPSGDSSSDSTSGTTSEESTNTDSGSSSTSSGGSTSSDSGSSSSGTASGGEESAPVTGSAITGNVISDISRGNGFLNYLFGK